MMKVQYTGRNIELSEAEKGKAQRKFDKIHKILGGNSSLEANVILVRQRHRCEAEVTLRAFHHTLVVTGANTEPFVALTLALDKLEKQALRNKLRIVDSRRTSRQRGQAAPVVEAVVAAVENSQAVPVVDSEPRIVRSNGVAPKPMTVEEATLALQGSNQDQVTFRDAESGGICVLLRRRDGALELVEA